MRGLFHFWVEGAVVADIINLDAYRGKERGEAVRRAITQLSKFCRDLHELAVTIALDGTLRQWAEEQAVGTIVTFDDDRLVETRDPAVVALVQLRGTIANTIDALSMEVR